MDPIETLVAQGGLGLVAAISMWLFVGERKDHKETRKENAVIIKEKDAEIKALMEARRVDVVDYKDQVVELAQDTSQSLQLIGAKIEAVQQRKS